MLQVDFSVKFLGITLKTTFMNYYLHVLQNFKNFSGRARRKEYWMYTLIYIPILFLAMIADNALGTTFQMEAMGQSVDIGYGWVYVIVGLLHFLPSLSVVVRRLHDVGKSGWWLLLQFTVIGAIPLVIWFASEGTTKGYTGPTKRRTSARNYDDAPKKRSRSGKADLTDELEELQELYEDGTLSEAQFKKAKNKLLK